MLALTAGPLHPQPSPSVLSAARFAVAKPAAAGHGGGLLVEAEKDLRVLSGEVERFVGIDPHGAAAA